MKGWGAVKVDLRRSREDVPATGEGKPLKAESQGRYPHETRRGGCWRSNASRGCESLKALHSRGWKPGVGRCRLPEASKGTKPHGRPPLVERVVRDRVPPEAAWFESNSERQGKGMRG